MSEELRVRFDQETMGFLRAKKASGGYRSAQDYIRHLVRRELETEQSQSSLRLRNQLRPGLLASEDEFLPLDASSIIAEAKRRGLGNGV